MAEDFKPLKKKNLDFILDNIVGGGSWYQWTTLLAMAPLWISEWPMTVRKPQPQPCFINFYIAAKVH